MKSISFTMTKIVSTHLKLLSLFLAATLVVACGNGDELVKRAEEAAKQGEQALSEMEDHYGGVGGDLLQEAPNTDVQVSLDGYSQQSFDKVYRYQANINESSTFIWMTFDNNDMDDQHIAVTLDLAGISGEGEYVLDRQRNGNIYLEIDGLAFRSDAGNAKVKITSASGEYLEGTFSAEQITRTQNRGSEVISIKDARFKLPLNDMRRK